jgi:hypothetical protein
MYCPTCRTPLQFSNPIREDESCSVCGYKPYSDGVFLFNDTQLFADVDRERDNILWRVKSGSIVWPVYHDGKCDAPSRSGIQFEEVSRAMVDDGMGITRFMVRGRRLLERDYILHDNNLHQVLVNHQHMVGNIMLRSALLHSGMIYAEEVKYFGIDARVGFFDSLYAYEFPKPFASDNGWIMGFLTHFSNVIADDVDMEQDDDISDGV